MSWDWSLARWRKDGTGCRKLDYEGIWRKKGSGGGNRIMGGDGGEVYGGE
jgi:hypothetical protein